LGVDGRRKGPGEEIAQPERTDKGPNGEKCWVAKVRNLFGGTDPTLSRKKKKKKKFDRPRREKVNGVTGNGNMAIERHKKMKKSIPI